MILKTKGIVLSHIKYKETSIITKIYTSEFGLRSYIVNGIRTKKSNGRLALYQPLTILELDVYEQKTKNIQRISDAKCAIPYHNIPFEIHKTTIAIFLAEFLYKLLQNAEEKDTQKYNFIELSLEYFDKSTAQINLFHIQFLARLLKFSGTLPEDSSDIITQLNAETFRRIILTDSEKTLFSLLFNQSYQEKLTLDKSERTLFLEILLSYYQLHEPHLNSFNSLQVLQEVFNA